MPSNIRSHSIITGSQHSQKSVVPHPHYFDVLQYGATGQVGKNSLRYRMSEYDDSTPGSVKLSSYSAFDAWLNTLEDRTLRSGESDVQNWSNMLSKRSFSSSGDFRRLPTSVVSERPSATGLSSSASFSRRSNAGVPIWS
mmetsp:Transcript_17088/g.35123  ORF Transcript_17088/g.35123 Transcript_17088/m.35123 type:complete len:140 (+) Transcript_17088:164-583(+)